MTTRAPAIEQRPFDAAAALYDQEFDSRRPTVRLRQIMMKVFVRYFPTHGSLLELNCGTGTDAIALANHCMTVYATDDSPAMVTAAREKVARAGLTSQITVDRLSFDELDQLRGRMFDGVYSNFGGLNCVPDLSSIAAAVSTLMKPGGYFVLCVMTDFSIWETTAFLLRLRWHTAFRRLRRDGVDARVHETTLSIYYHSPDSIRSAFEPRFELVEIGGLSVFTPPPGATKANSVLRPVIPFLELLDDAVHRSYPFRRIGDHCYIVMRRTTRGSLA